MKKISLLGLLALAPCVAHADLIPTLNHIDGGPGDYTWHYNLTLTQDQNAVPGPAPTMTPVPHSSTGSFFTVYDFSGYIDGTCISPTGWSCSVQNVGMTPDQVNPVAPPDNAGIVNLTWSYQGPGVLVGPQFFDGFAAQTTVGAMAQTSFSGRGTKNVGAQAGTVVDNVGNVEGPAPLPEPASLGLLGLALGALAARRRKSI